jgi:hypothetical protein
VMCVLLFYASFSTFCLHRSKSFWMTVEMGKQEVRHQFWSC